MSAISPTAGAASASRSATRPTLRGLLGLDLLDNRYPALHGLRFLAILSVVQFHVTSMFAFDEHLPLAHGFVASSLTIFFGMDLFFVLSGFLIGSILLRSLQAPGKKRIRRFYLRRIFRTFPAYYVVLTVLALIGPLTVMQRHNLIYEYAYLTDFRVITRFDLVMLWGWSLALEEQFYLAVPLLFFALLRLKSDRARIALLTCLFFGGLASRLFIWHHYGPWSDEGLYGAIYFRTYTRFDTLIAGILLAFVHDRHGPAIAVWLQKPFHRALLAMPSLACLYLLLRPWMFGWPAVQLVHVFAWGTVTSIMYFCFLLLLLHGGQGWVSRALSLPVFRSLATLGYGVYLVHIPLCTLLILPLGVTLTAYHVSMALVWPLSVAALMLASLVVAYGMHLFIEKPALALRQRLAA